MPRTGRASVGGVCYHVLNRGNARRTVFSKDGDYAAFLTALGHAHEELPMRVLAYCLMPNHFHLVLWPHADGDLSRWMHWLTNAHVRRYHQHYHSSGHLWQGRFKAFPIAEDEHLLTVLRYVERNPVRAELVTRAEQWSWSSLLWRSGALGAQLPTYLHAGPVARPADWVAWVNEALTDAELERVRRSVKRGRPYGPDAWAAQTAKRLGLEATLRPQGRPSPERDPKKMDFPFSRPFRPPLFDPGTKLAKLPHSARELRRFRTEAAQLLGIEDERTIGEPKRPVSPHRQAKSSPALLWRAVQAPSA